MISSHDSFRQSLVNTPQELMNNDQSATAVIDPSPLQTEGQQQYLTNYNTEEFQVIEEVVINNTSD